MPLDGLPWDGEERPDDEEDSKRLDDNLKSSPKLDTGSKPKTSKNLEINKNVETTKISSKPLPDALHKKVITNVKKRKKQASELKKRWMPGAIGEIFTFLFALLLAYLFIQTMGYMLNTSLPLVVVESESMVHEDRKSVV